MSWTDERVALLRRLWGEGKTAAEIAKELGVAALLEGCRFIGAELDPDYADQAVERLEQTLEGTVRVRDDKPVYKPDPKSSVAQRPEHFRSASHEPRALRTIATASG